jgi:regulator of protease activity HflC (stomatin/prohibitin superfamily)
VVPVVDKVARFVDQRIRVTDFSAETTLTSDTVPVNVDAIAFWVVWDAQKAVLEVEHFGGGSDSLGADRPAQRHREE